MSIKSNNNKSSDSSEERRSQTRASDSRSQVGYFSSIYFDDHGKHRRLEEVNALYKQVSAQSLYGLSPIDDGSVGLSQNAFDEMQKVGLEKLLRHRIEFRGQYLRFASILVWFCVYVSAAYFQSIDVQVASLVTRSTMDSLVLDISKRGSGSYGYADSKLGTTNYLKSFEDILGWINESIIETVFVDAICGDGICSETEFPGFGRFGCTADCGSYQNVTAVTIDLVSFMNSKPIINLDKWDISHVIPTLKANPRFRWNIYSETLEDYIFSEDQEEGEVTVNLLDGVYSFELYQTAESSINVSAEDMYLNGYIVAGTVPPREALTAYKYGDYREYLSTTIAILDAMYNYCYSSGIPLNPDGTEDMECRTYFDKSFEVRAFSGYGLSGSITREDGNRPPVEIVSVPYCGVYPNGSKGLGGMRQVWQGIEIVDEWVTSGPQGGADVNLPILMNAQIPCTSGIDQATVNDLYRSLAKRRRQNRRLQQRALQAPRGGLVGRNASSGSKREARGTMEVESFWPGDRRLGNSSWEGVRRGGANLSRDGGPTLRINVSGPDSSLGGPGYEQGIFWAELCIELLGADTVAAKDTAIWYSAADSQMLNCSGVGGNLYSGPTMLSSMVGNGIVQAIACIGDLLIASGQTSPIPLVRGPHISVSIAFVKQGAAGFENSTSFSDAVVKALCAALEIFRFCQERVILDSIDLLTNNLTGHALSATNAEAGSWRRLFVLNGTILQYYMPAKTNLSVIDVRVTVPVPRYKLHHPWDFCTSHYDCAAVDPSRIGTNITYTSELDIAWGNGFCAAYGSRSSDGRAPTCDYCQLYCMIESIDSFDGICPEHCGNPFSGQLPPCVSAKKLQQTYSCSDMHRFELLQYLKAGEVVPDPRRAKMNVLRSLTPSNNLIGSVILTQYRVPISTCSSSTTPGMDNFTTLHGVQCADTAEVDSKPFGVDPAFTQSSTLFDGKHTPQDFYNLSTETFTTSQTGTPTVTPYGFFPYQWDCARKEPKNASQIWGSSVDEFKLYFDGRISHDQAQMLLQYMQDGRFFDVSTSRFKLEMITYNAEVKLFSTWTFIFDWQRTGDISWDYALQIVNMEDDDTNLNLFVSGLALFLLAFHLAIDLRTMYQHFVAMKIKKYFFSIFNTIDWVNFVIQIVAWQYWYKIRSNIAAFKMSASPNVLASPQAKFRPFTTNAEQEYQLLELIDQISTLGDLQGYHSSYAGISIILFVLKMIAALHFQPKMGLITRTLERAGGNMAHYIALYSLVFVGYAVVGNLMFGSLYSGMATLSMTCQTLMFFLLSFDPTEFYSQMNHAITHRQGSSIVPGSMEYNIYLWTFMFINAFILMNIFLAIIVSAFDDIARQSENSKGVLDDLLDTAAYYVKSAFWPHTHFVSDHELLAQVRTDLQSLAGTTWTETELNSRARVVKEALATNKAILVGRGVSLDKKQVKDLVQKIVRRKSLSKPGVLMTLWLKIGSRVWPFNRAAAMSCRVSDSGCSVATESFGRNSMSQFRFVPFSLLTQFAAVDEVFDRLGVDLRPKENEISDKLLRLLQIEGQGRMIDIKSRVESIETTCKQSATYLSSVAGRMARDTEQVLETEQLQFRDASCQEKKGKPSSPELTSSKCVCHSSVGSQHLTAADPRRIVGNLDVTVLWATGLPKMDLFRSCDAYCLLFLNEEGDERYADYLQFHSQAQETRVINSTSPAWGEKFQFRVSAMTRGLVLSVWDKDILTADDLIGGCEVKICDMSSGRPERGAFSLINASHAAKTRDALLFIETLYTPLSESTIKFPFSSVPESSSATSENSSLTMARRTNRWFDEGPDLHTILQLETENSACIDCVDSQVEESSSQAGQEISDARDFQLCAREMA